MAGVPFKRRTGRQGDGTEGMQAIVKVQLLFKKRFFVLESNEQK